MKVSVFARQFPTFAINFDMPIGQQNRIYQGATLDQLPVELEPDEAYHVGGRGRPNRNQTLAHSQCATCHRVLRNDCFYTVPSMMKRNVIFPHCRECNQSHNGRRHELRSELIRHRRAIIWSYLAPRCAICGFDKHISALELHHPQQKEALIAELVTHITHAIEPGKVESLLREAAKCVPLCSNCHHMVHADALALPDDYQAAPLRIADLLIALKPE